MKNIIHGALILLMLLLVSCNKFDTHPYIKKLMVRRTLIM